MGGQASWGSMSDHNIHPLIQSKEPTQTFMYPTLQLAPPHCIRSWHSLICRCLPSTGWMYKPHPSQAYSWGSDSETMSQEDSGLAITQHQARKTSLGWINGKLWLLPWMLTRASTDDGWRFQAMCSRHGCLLQRNEQEDHVCLVEGWMETHRCQQIANWLTTMTTHGTGMQLQDHWGMKWEYVSLCQAFWC